MGPLYLYPSAQQRDSGKREINMNTTKTCRDKNVLGARRLVLLHMRVNYLLNEVEEKKKSTEKTWCPLCSQRMEKMQHKNPKLYILTSIQCSGVEWICRARKECSRIEEISWNKEELMSRTNYSFLISKIIRNMEPRIALSSMDLFHYDLCKEQQHMVKITQVAEQTAYSTYQPFTLLPEMFPLPPIGEEMVNYPVEPATFSSKDIKAAMLKKREDHIHDHYIETIVQQCDCDNSKSEMEKTLCCTCQAPYTIKFIKMGNPYDYELSECSDMDEEEEPPLQKSVKHLPQQPDWGYIWKLNSEEKKEEEEEEEEPNHIKLSIIKAEELLKYVDIIAGIPKVCAHCKTYKFLHPNREVHCSGHYDLDYFKFRMFQEKPHNMEKRQQLDNTILKTNNLKNYQKQLDKIFSVDFIERAIEIKLKFDTEVINCYPYMSPLIALYDALLLRWYWPQALKQKDSEEEMSEEENTSTSSDMMNSEESDMSSM